MDPRKPEEAKAPEASVVTHDELKTARERPVAGKIVKYKQNSVTGKYTVTDGQHTYELSEADFKAKYEGGGGEKPTPVGAPK